MKEIRVITTMRRVKPWIQHTAAVLAFTNLMLIAGHIEWWDPERGRHLNVPLLLFLFVSTFGCLCLTDSEDPCWNEDDEDLRS